ncbi:MAG TPA: HAMP domain-containing sensor histidine kinase [Puia sp.]|jgi:signal transduction histidine kinase|nr:HAMP domain-containing sensor histidine kinase [Puia sp.]
MLKEISRISLENEMDIVVAHKRVLSVAQFFSMLLSTQTTLATAVAEVSRVVIEKTDDGWLSIGMDETAGRFSLVGTVSFPPDIDVRLSEEGLRYAQLLVPEFRMDRSKEISSISLGMGIPRSLKISKSRISEAAEYFQTIEPATPYERLKLRNTFLNRQALETEAELRHSRLLDEKKNEFISIASHELKTPLTSLIAFTKLALNTEESEASPKVRRYLEKIDNQTHKLHQLIQQLLDISRIESGRMDYNMQNREWNTYMREMMLILEHMVPTHRLTWQPCEASVMVMMDALRIEQVLTNLVNNAAKYSEPNTPIVIICSSDDEALTICIRDEGIGISRQNMTRIFEKYFRDEAVANKYSGFGMGLYITSGIVREHRGTIWAENNEKTGSSFYFTLPVLSSQS